MAQTLEQVQNIDKQDDHYQALNQANKVQEKRSLIHGLLDNFSKTKMATSETIKEYRKAADNDPTAEGLEGFYRWMKGQWSEANHRLADMQREMDKAIRDKTMSETDREHLLKDLLLTDRDDFVGELDKAEQVLKDKLERRKEDRDKFDEILNHELAEDGIIVVSATTQIAVPSEDEYLKMKVPERRKFLDAAEAALPKAKAYSEKVESHESSELDKEYTGLLDKALNKDKIIGQKTYGKFMNAFRKLSVDDKRYWVQEFEGEMNRYEKLWSSIRSTFEGETLEEIESKRDALGYSQLFAKVGELKARESFKNTKKYKKVLDENLGEAGEGAISMRTYKKFLVEFKQMPLNTQYEWMNKLEDEMRPYAALAAREANLTGKQKEVLEHFWHDWGKTERQEFLNNPNDDKYQFQMQQGVRKRNWDLESMQDEGIIEAFEDANSDLNKRGKDAKRTFLSSVKQMFEKKTADSADADDFQSKLQSARKVREEKEETQEAEPTNSGEDFAAMQRKLRGHDRREQEIEEEMETAEGEKAIDLEIDHADLHSAGIVEDEGFDQVEQLDTDGQTERITRVEINKEKGLDRFFSENQKHSYKAQEDGGDDDLRIAIRRKDGQKEELNKASIFTMIDYMESDEANDDLDKAA